MFSIRRDTEFPFLCYVVMDRDIVFTLVKGTAPALNCEKNNNHKQTVTSVCTFGVFNLF